MNTTKHHNDRSRSYRAGSSSLRVTQATGIGDCSPELEAIAIPAPGIRSLPSYLENHESIFSCTNVSVVDADRCSNSNSSTPETCTAADSKNLLLLLPGSGPVLEPPDNSSSSAAEDAKVDTPLAPIPPMQWLSEKGTPPASPKHRTPCFQQQFGSSGQSDEKPSQEHEASDDNSNLLQESVFFSAAQELAKMSPPPPWVPRPKYPLLDVKAVKAATEWSKPDPSFKKHFVQQERTDTADKRHCNFFQAETSFWSELSCDWDWESYQRHHSEQSRWHSAVFQAETSFWSELSCDWDWESYQRHHSEQSRWHSAVFQAETSFWSELSCDWDWESYQRHHSEQSRWHSAANGTRVIQVEMAELV
ncbi:hypothetical protein ZEAMMB73_Zm00001d013353 [Zea mays]|uniref:Uncharacterized protein n=1 Tax=Zea mays TaxID=4577 RepID=A0A1D6GIA5_MAIZE|nr:hypothetical protein ZEAMMB73_Zm00001d013353 [Zea mays]